MNPLGSAENRERLIITPDGSLQATDDPEGTYTAI